MVDLTAIGTISASLKAAKDIAEAAMGLRDAELIRSKILEMQSKILDAQASAFAAHDERASLMKTIADLEAEIAKHDRWALEKQRYELAEIVPGILAYSIKEEMRRGEPFHRICANCYNNEKKSFLQQIGGGVEIDRYRCNECGDELVIRRHSNSLPKSARRTSSYWGS